MQVDKPDMSHLAQQRVEEAAVFRCAPFDWTIKDFSKPAGTDEHGNPTPATHSHALVIRFAAIKKWHPEGEGAWSQKWPEGWFIEVSVWIIGKDGNPNEAAIKNLAECGIWDGDLDKIETQAPSKVWCHVTVEEESYQGKPQFRGAWINPDADRPAGRGGFKPTSPETMSSLRARFGVKLKAIGGNKPAGKPAAPGGVTPSTTPQTTPSTTPATTPTPEPAGDPLASEAPATTGGPIEGIEDEKIPF